ncbi:unnamed protein product [Discosporangium mesarthrocarpum]
MKEFHAHNVRPKWLVIDDGWQETTNDDALNTEQWGERLVGLQANKKFRTVSDDGHVSLELGDTVRRIKEDFQVETVISWHAMAGYWAGVEPEAHQLARFQPYLSKLQAPLGIQEVDKEIQEEFDGKRFGMVPPHRASEFYLAYHQYLKDNAIDGVKVDAQAMLDAMGQGNGGVPLVTGSYHRGLSQSVQASFKDGDTPAPVIHCMCHASCVLYHIAALSEDTPLIRGSDDFYPEEENSHGSHIYNNAYNALLLSNLGMQDWDMFQTDLGTGDSRVRIQAGAKASWFHAAARAVSGGPVYISDKPGKLNSDIIGKLVLEDGSVLRAKTNALPTIESLLKDPQKADGGLLQVWALNPLPSTAVVGSFNVRGSSYSQGHRSWIRTEQGPTPPVGGEVGPSDVHPFAMSGTPAKQAGVHTAATTAPGVVAAEGGGCSDCYAVYLHERDQLHVMGLEDSLSLEVPSLGFELATVSRLVSLPWQGVGGGGPGEPGGRGDGSGVFSSAHHALQWAVVGLVRMFNSAAAVTAQEVFWFHGDESSGNPAVPAVRLAVRGSGRLLGVSTRMPKRVILTSAGLHGDNSPQSSSGSTSGVNLPFKYTAIPYSGRKVERESNPLVSWSSENDTQTSSLPDKIVGDCDVKASDRKHDTHDGSSGKGGIGSVEVDLPWPWDGAERSVLITY